MADSIDLIERYFGDDLSPEELKGFQLRLETDEAFAQAYELEKDLMEGIEVMGNKNLKEELQGYYKEEVEEKINKKTALKPRAVSRRIWLSVAASIALLFFAGWWLSKPTAESLYAEYFQPEFDFVEKGEQEELVIKIEIALKNKDYISALPLLDDFLDQQPNNSYFILAKGISLIETGAFKEGINALQKAQSINPLYKSESLWYNALALLKQGKTEESRKALNSISKKSSNYNKAQELLKKLNF